MKHRIYDVHKGDWTYQVYLFGRKIPNAYRWCPGCGWVDIYAKDANDRYLIQDNQRVKMRLYGTVRVWETIEMETTRRYIRRKRKYQ